jgi:hypothetical protein
MARNSHEVFLLVAALLSGIVGLALPGSHGRAVVAAFPGWFQTLWYAGLLAGAVLSMIGVLRGDVVGALVERGGQLILAGFSTAYAAGLAIFAGLPASPAAFITVAFGAACFLRSVQIKSSVRALREGLAVVARHRQ